MWFALLTQHDLWQRCCSSGPRETNLRNIRPSFRTQCDRILPSLAAFVWQEARSGDRLSLVPTVDDRPRLALSSVKGSSRWMLNEKVP